MSKKLNRLFLIVKKENITFARSRKFIYLILALFALGILQIALIIAFNSGKSSLESFIYATYNTYVQFLPLALIPILSPSISGEKENKTWNFYKIHTFKNWEIILGKSIFYNISILISMGIVWILVTFISVIIFKDSRLHYSYILLVVLISLASISCIINFEIFISSLFSKTSIAGLSTVIGWISVTVINILVPRQLGKGYLTPFAKDSYQTHIVARLLSIPDYIFPFTHHQGQPIFREVTSALIYAFAISLFWVSLSLIFGRYSFSKIFKTNK
ncbi:hypothetical protein Csac_2177 [Caldicellulosiruptor saccharolyticus DSM 8903]|uniref:Uncharacterized protein n=1 Tax=Caldicellulosiruptor saccharolyticus (strain ATCC 43494 / DSM 8903 / Tp8T 6331) TaxID=351627 RepID=A4XLH4_CALS8|nr:MULTISPECIES: ABC transporter permease subunit [Caldicellulosiruptor]ABP67759.1 hypothetical protein Csac_2177 [Caldicellulosiruptor saccharolyticus DSM 8903]